MISGLLSDEFSLRLFYFVFIEYSVRNNCILAGRSIFSVSAHDTTTGSERSSRRYRIAIELTRDSRNHQAAVGVYRSRCRHANIAFILVNNL